MGGLLLPLLGTRLLFSADGGAGYWESCIEGLEEMPTLTLAGAEGADLTVVVLKGLGERKVSAEIALAAMDRHRSLGYRIVELDYHGQGAARFPEINRDIARIRAEILEASFLPGVELNQARVFVLPEGFGLETEVVYYSNPKRDLKMDIAYPLNMAKGRRVPCLLEFSCDNSNRMGNYSLVACRDTLLEGFATLGYAIAMADHPVAPPYKGIDPMPDCAFRVKAAARTLRGMAGTLPLNGKLGVVGFSRGSGMALLLATSEGLHELERGGRFLGEDSSVQAAVVLSGRFSYLSLLEGDHMIPRYEKKWGKLADNFEHWKAHGVADYLRAPTIPLFVSINSGEGADAQEQTRQLRNRLDSFSSPYEFVLDDDDAGHKAPIDARTLSLMRGYLERTIGDAGL